MKLVNPPPKPKVEKQKGGKKNKVIQQAVSRVVVASNSDTDSDETI